MKPKLSALIVEDEENAAALLEKLLLETNHFELVKVAPEVDAAVSALKSFIPDIIFLDIRFPGEDGFSLTKQLSLMNVHSAVVFVTAHDEFAIRALKEQAFDYLLKPVNRQELSECINRYQERHAVSNSVNELTKILHVLDGHDKLRFNTRTGFIFIHPSAIISCHADGGYTKIQLDDKHHLCSVLLGTVEQMLPRPGFARLGRSLIINLRYLASVDRKRQVITMEKDGRTFEMEASRAQLKELDELKSAH